MEESLHITEQFEQLLHLVTAVRKFHGFNSRELLKLLRNSDDFTLQCVNENGISVKLEVETLAGFLPLHLIALIITAKRDETLFKHLLSGIQLLGSFYYLATKNRKLEQILFEDIKVEQVVNLVIYLLVILGRYRQETSNPSPVPLLHSTLITCSLHLLSGCISSNWQDLAQILCMHPKVNMFMEVAFGAVNVAVHFLQIKLMSQNTKFCIIHGLPAEQIAYSLCHQCEASVQFLRLLCKQKMFQERLLENEELCENGGVLFLIESILKLKIAPPFVRCQAVVAAVSRMKARVLEILLDLCESDDYSFLDEVTKSPRSLTLAESVASEVFHVMKTGLDNQPKRPLSNHSDKTYPTGFLQLNALRVADIFSDDSNFRSYITLNFTELFNAIFSLYHRDFLPIWCSSDFPLREKDTTLDYDSFTAAGWVLDSLSLPKTKYPEVNVVPVNMPQALYAHKRTSSFVKVIGNLHCFNPNICRVQEKNLFLNKFLGCLENDPSKLLPGFSFTSGSQKVDNICRNLCSLLNHADSLVPHILKGDDLYLLRVVVDDLTSMIKLHVENRTQKGRSVGVRSSPSPRIELPNHNKKTSKLKERVAENSAFQHDQGNETSRRHSRKDSGSDESDTSSRRGKRLVAPVKEKELSSKRKRTIMNEEQLSLIESALLDEPEMQRNAASIRHWAEILSPLGSEVITTFQLRNWLYKRRSKRAV